MQLKVLNITRVLLEKNKQKLDIYKTWATPIIKIWVSESAMERNDCIVKWQAQDAIEMKTRAREKLVKEWMQTFKLLGSDWRHE